MNDIYSIDTSSLMDWQLRFYPADVFPGIAERVDALMAAGRLFCASLVREELEAVGTPDLVQWAGDHEKIFVPTPELLASALSIQNQFPGLRDPKSAFEEADSYVVALARRHPAGVVVTQETPAAEKHKPKRTHFIPDVCRELGACISFLGLLRREAWKFP